MQIKGKTTHRAVQAHGDVTSSQTTALNAVSAGRVVLNPQTKNRLARRFFDLRHSAWQIARSEGVRLNVIEGIVREKYWSALDTGAATNFGFLGGGRAA